MWHNAFLPPIRVLFAWLETHGAERAPDAYIFVEAPLFFFFQAFLSQPFPPELARAIGRARSVMRSYRVQPDAERAAKDANAAALAGADSMAFFAAKGASNMPGDHPRTSPLVKLCHPFYVAGLIAALGVVASITAYT